MPELREAIAAKVLRDSGYEVSTDQVVVTNGGKQAVYEAFQILLNDGDEVIIPTPYWTSYPEAVKLADGVPVEVFAGADVNFEPSLEARGCPYRADQGHHHQLAEQPDRCRMEAGNRGSHRTLGC